MVDASLLVETQRLYKSPREQEVMRQAAAMGDTALEAARAAMAPGMMETEIEAVMTASLMEQGLQLSSHPHDDRVRRSVGYASFRTDSPSCEGG